MSRLCWERDSVSPFIVQGLGLTSQREKVYGRGLLLSLPTSSGTGWPSPSIPVLWRAAGQVAQCPPDMAWGHYAACVQGMSRYGPMYDGWPECFPLSAPRDHTEPVFPVGRPRPYRSGRSGVLRSSLSLVGGTRSESDYGASADHAFFRGAVQASCTEAPIDGWIVVSACRRVSRPARSILGALRILCCFSMPSIIFTMFACWFQPGLFN